MAFGVYYLAGDGRPDWRSCALYLKPANILLLDDGRTPVVADFGLCHICSGTEVRKTTACPAHTKIEFCGF